ncbi:MAG: hypothetical protein RLY40_626 [Pseudomonadota bacterium]|jgi:ankyrin repeat protein
MFSNSGHRGSYREKKQESNPQSDEELQELNKQLIRFCEKENPDEKFITDVEELLKKGADPNYNPVFYFPPLHIVKSREIASLLIKYGGKIDEPNSINMTAMHMARSVEMIDFFARNGADCKTKREFIGAGNFKTEPQTPLQYQISISLRGLRRDKSQIENYPNDPSKKARYENTEKNAKDIVNAHIKAIFLSDPNAKLDDYLVVSDRMKQEMRMKIG